MDYIKAQTLTPSLFSLFHETRISLILVFWWDFYFDLGFPSISRTEASKRLKIELENWFCKKDTEFISNVTVTWWLSTEFNFHVELNFGYSEKATKFEKISNLKFDVTQYCQILSGRFFQILWPSQNIRTLTHFLKSKF